MPSGDELEIQQLLNRLRNAPIMEKAQIARQISTLSKKVKTKRGSQKATANSPSQSIGISLEEGAGQSIIEEQQNSDSPIPSLLMTTNQAAKSLRTSNEGAKPQHPVQSFSESVILGETADLHALIPSLTLKDIHFNTYWFDVIRDSHTQPMFIDTMFHSDGTRREMGDFEVQKRRLKPSVGKWVQASDFGEIALSWPANQMHVA